MQGKTKRNITKVRSTQTQFRYEKHFQKACVEWFRLIYRRYLIFSIPNGAWLKGNVQYINSLKAQGMTNGVPDLFIAHGNKLYHGLFIELKVQNRKQTDDQEDIAKQLREAGYKVEVCKTSDEFMKVITDYFKIK